MCEIPRNLKRHESHDRYARFRCREGVLQRFVSTSHSISSPFSMTRLGLNLLKSYCRHQSCETKFERRQDMRIPATGREHSEDELGRLS